jgi:hypothetical protein
MSKQATEIKQKPATPARNAFKERNWGILFVTFIFFLSSVATLAMVLVSVTEDVFRIVPAAALLGMVEVWLMFTLPFYWKLSFWGSLIFLATYLFFAVPVVALNLVPGVWLAIIIALIVASVACFIILFVQRYLFIPRPKPIRTTPRPKAPDTTSKTGKEQ